MIRKLFPLYGSPSPRIVLLAGRFTIGASGAITLQTGAKYAGATVTQTAAKTGRYGVAFTRTWKHCHSVTVTFDGPDDSAFPTTTGSQLATRLFTTSGFSIQAVRADTQADALPASGSIICWTAIVSTV